MVVNFQTILSELEKSDMFTLIIANIIKEWGEGSTGLLLVSEVSWLRFESWRSKG